MVKEKICDCKNKLPLYARDQTTTTQFISLKKKLGYRVLMCLKCGKIFREKIEEVEE